MADMPSETVHNESSELDTTRQRLEAMELELANYRLRLADFENARKRMLRDAEAERKYSTEAITRDLLPALDNLDRALDAAKLSGDVSALAAGVSATATQLLDILRRHGVTRIDCAPGTAFDPSRHEAVMQQPTTEYAPGEIVQVLQKGFLLHDRVLRPAGVIVASAQD